MYNLIKTQSIHKRDIDWGLMDVAFYNLLKEAKSSNDTINALIFVFEKMDDVHSNISYKSLNYSYFHTASEEEQLRVQQLFKKQRTEINTIRISTLKNNTGYIQIPAINAFGTDVDIYTQMLKDSICILKKMGIKQCIIDLRLNSGGNMYPMLSGLSAFFTPGKIGSSVNADSEIVFNWILKEDNLFFESSSGAAWQMTFTDDSCKVHFENIPVVVLLSYITASSGQAVAIALKGRPNTHFIGEETAYGYATGNDFFYFSPVLYMNLSTAYNRDTNNTIYKQQVLPNVYLNGGDNFENLMQDEKIKAALLWFDKE